DRDATMAAAENEMARPRVLRHANEIIGPRKKAGEDRRVRNLPAHCKPERGPDHVLLGDESLEEALRALLRELLQAGRVLHIAIQRHDRMLLPAELLHCRAERLPGSHPLAQPVLRLAFARLAPLDHRGGPRPARFDGLTGTRVPELRQGLHHLLAAQHLAMPAFGSFEKRHTLALHGSRDDGIGPSLARTPHGFED